MTFCCNFSIIAIVKECLHKLNVQTQLYVYNGKNKIVPANSCKELYTIVPQSSGYYWVKAFDGSIIQVYCDMSATCGNTTGGLAKIVTINANTWSKYCIGNVNFEQSNGCFKKSTMPGCSGFVLTSPNLNFSHICGTVEGSYFGIPDGFAGSGRSSTTTIDDNYVDGISMTYGNTSRRTHLWTFSACEGACTTARVPEFVGNHYSNISFNSHSDIMFQRNFLPTLNEDIEIRLCQDEDRPYEGIYLTSMNIYVN